MSAYAGTLTKGARGYGAGTYPGIYKNNVPQSRASPHYPWVVVGEGGGGWAYNPHIEAKKENFVNNFLFPLKKTYTYDGKWLIKFLSI